MKNLKLVLTIVFSLMLIFTISTAVFADNELGDDIWSDTNIVDDDDNTVEDTANETENEAVGENANELEELNELEEELNEEENEYNNLYTTANSTTTNSENLADTGIGNSSVVALIIIVSAIAAIYSAKKFNDYKNV